jgi:hypothetical protein
VGVNLSKVTKSKKTMSFGFKHDLFSFALMNIFVFHAINSAFSKCFPKKGKEQNHSSAHPFSRFWKWGICPFTSSPYAMEMMFLS